MLGLFVFFCDLRVWVCVSCWLLCLLFVGWRANCLYPFMIWFTYCIWLVVLNLLIRYFDCFVCLGLFVVWFTGLIFVICVWCIACVGVLFCLLLLLWCLVCLYWLFRARFVYFGWLVVVDLFCLLTLLLLVARLCFVCGCCCFVWV